jgi:citrate synthase
MSDVSDWWRTAIIEMQPGQIRLRGHPIETLIDQVSMTEMIWLMTTGALPSPAQHRLLNAALVAAVDHGPQAPSIAITRMAMTCGVGINSALASGVNTLGDIHGGAGEQALALYLEIRDSLDQDMSLETAVNTALDRYRAHHGPHIPGFGHRFHKPTDPRSAPLMTVLRTTADEDTRIDGRFAGIAETIQSVLSRGRSQGIAMNIDGATAAIYGSLGVDPTLARGLFCLSRSVGLVAHAYEQSMQGGRNKGPTPPHYRWSYDGPNHESD